MKYVLILTLCNFLEGQIKCDSNETAISPYEYNSWSQCVLEGYRQSYNVLKEVYGPRIETEKLAIKFNCKGVDVT